MLTPSVHRLPTQTLRILPTSGKAFTPLGRKKVAILSIYRVFGPETPKYSRIEIWQAKGTFVPVPNITLVRESCRPGWAKKN